MVSKSKKKICINENCNEIAKYGLVNPETGMLEVNHCKIHKANNEKYYTLFKWQFRYNDMIKITTNRNIKLLDNKTEYIDKTKKNGCDAYLSLQCLICLDIVTTTNIDSFIRANFGCLCNTINPWYNQYKKFLQICSNNNVKLLDTEEEYIKKTTKNGRYTKLNLQCLTCLDIVDTTNIHDFIRNHLGCHCNKNIAYYEKHKEFLQICQNNNVKLLDTEEEYIKKTRKNGNNTFLNLQCLECNTIVTTTSISNFINHNCLGCNCSKKKSEKCLGEILKDIFPDYNFTKIRPYWLKNKQGNNLELDYYNEELKRAYEYQGEQHEKYVPFYHNNDINNFYKQQEHDRIKKLACEKIGIKLICIPSKYDYTNPLEMCDYILDNL